MARTINPFGASTRDTLAEAERMAASPRRSQKATLEKYRQCDHPLEAALEEELGFTFYDTVLTRGEIAAWESFYGPPFVCPLRRIARAAWTDQVVLVVSCNSSGKTHTFGRIAALYAKMFPPEASKGDYGSVWVGTAPPEQNLRNKIFAHVQNVYVEHPDLFADDRLSDLKLKNRLNTLSGVEGQPFPQSGTEAQRIASWTGKHAPHMVLIGDEADGIPEIFWPAIETCLSGADNHLLVGLNPKHAVGYVYERYRRRAGTIVEIAAFDTPNVIAGEVRIPGLVSREDTVLDIMEKSRRLAEGEEADQRAFRVPTFLDGATVRAPSGKRLGPLVGGEWRVSQDAYLDYKVLGRYPAQSEQRLYADHWIDAARARYDDYEAQHGDRPPVGVRPVLGLDPSEGGEGDPNALVLRYGGYVKGPMTRAGADVNETGAWATTVFRQYGCRLAFVDAISYGQGTAHIMIDGYTYHPEEAAEPIVIQGLDRSQVVLVKVSRRPEALHETKDGSFKLLRDFLAWRVMTWLRHEPSLGVFSQAMLPPDENLLLALRSIEWTTDRAGLITTTAKDELRRRLGSSPNAFDALAATFADGLGAATRSALGASRSLTL